MKRLFSVLIVTLAAAACGGGTGGARADMVRSCVDSGEDEALCSCLAEGLEGELDPKLFKKIAAEAAKSGDSNDDFLDTLPAEEQGAVLGALMSVGMSCALGSMGG